MNRIVYLLLVIVAGVAVALCCSNKARGYGNTDDFRLYMEYGFGPSSPGTIPPGASFWYDVGDWQIFLKNHGESTYLGATYPTNNFDSNTEMATKDWQNKNGLTPTGIVDPTTYQHSEWVAIRETSTIAAPCIRIRTIIQFDVDRTNHL